MATKATKKAAPKRKPKAVKKASATPNKRTPKSGPRARNSKTSPQVIEARERERKALQLRKAGASYEEIAGAIGYADHSGARDAVLRAMERMVKEPAEEVRQLELARLDDLQKRHWALAGEVRNARLVLDIMERRAKLLGIDKLPPITLSEDDWVFRTQLADGTVLVVPPGVDPIDAYQLYVGQRDAHAPASGEEPE